MVNFEFLIFQVSLYFTSICNTSWRKVRLLHASSDSLCLKRTEEHQLDAIEWFMALTICSTCFGHFYAHHQELETILVLLPHMMCNALVVCGRLLGAEQQAMRPGWGKCIACCSAPDRRPPTTKPLHTIRSNSTSIVSSSWWWAYKCRKHVEQIISAINHSVASSWCSSLRLYNDAGQAFLIRTVSHRFRIFFQKWTRAH